MLTLGEIPRNWSRQAPDREALVFGSHRLSWRALDQRVDRLAHAFRRLGVGRGEHVAVLAFNQHRYVELYYAASRAGNVVVPLNWRLAGDELRHILEDSDTVAVFVDPEFLPVVEEIRHAVPKLRAVVSLDGRSGQCGNYEDLIAGEPYAPFPDTGDENALTVLMYTGGTTGRPKGVMLSNRNLITGIQGCAQAVGIRPTDTTLLVLPIFHIALWPVIAAHLVGGSAVLSRQFALTEMLDTIERERITHVNLVPTIVAFLLAAPELDDHDLSSLRVITYGGSSMPRDLLRRLLARFPETEIAQGYGMTEAAPIVSALDDAAHRDSESELGMRRLASVGRRCGATEVRVVDEDDEPLGPSMTGEIVVRGPNVMLGYWKMPDLTADRLRGGWFHTQDMGQLDEDGFLFVVGRKDDMIITGGENVYPREVEEVILTHPAVAECAVIGMPDPVWGEQVVAVVVPRAGETVCAEDIISLCAQRLAGYKKPRRVAFRDQLPKTQIGKVSYRDVRMAELARESSDFASLS